MSGPEQAKGERGQTSTIELENLADASEIVFRLGLKRIPVVYNWIKQYPDFPAPVLVLRANTAKVLRLWDFREVKAWHVRRVASHKAKYGKAKKDCNSCGGQAE